VRTGLDGTVEVELDGEVGAAGKAATSSPETTLGTAGHAVRVATWLVLFEQRFDRADQVGISPRARRPRR
jgi:hypothetical protein